jgi:Uma2 family endonuclease
MAISDVIPEREGESAKSVGIAKHSFTAEEFERIGRAGIFREDARLELIEGEIFEMSPIGSHHAACVNFLSRLLNRLFGDNHIVATQNPVRLNNLSEPQPDICLLRWRDDFYRDSHPGPADVLLLSEVADTTVVTDLSVKVPLYAGAGIAEAWLVKIPEEEVVIYSEPSGVAYRHAQLFERGKEVRSHTIAGLAVSVNELFG